MIRNAAPHKAERTVKKFALCPRLVHASGGLVWVWLDHYLADQSLYRALNCETGRHTGLGWWSTELKRLR